jgi:hypothetical protein
VDGAPLNATHSPFRTSMLGDFFIPTKMFCGYNENLENNDFLPLNNAALTV